MGELSSVCDSFHLHRRLYRSMTAILMSASILSADLSTWFILTLVNSGFPAKYCCQEPHVEWF